MVIDQLLHGVVTAIEPDPRRAASVRVTTSGGTVYTIPADRLGDLGLEHGVRLDGERIAGLSGAADEEAALRAGLAAIGRRAFARTDLGRRLRRRGHPRPAIQSALERLERLGLLDDLRFARDFVDTRAERGRGPARLRRDLQALGVRDAVVDEAIRVRWPSGDVEPGVPQALALRRSRQLGALPRPTKRRRLLAFLARRGFTGQSAREAVTRALATEYQSS
jgi:regulatory protein